MLGSAREFLAWSDLLMEYVVQRFYYLEGAVHIKGRCSAKSL